MKKQYKEYTLAFLFTKDLQKVLLINKLRPDWQKGYLNGIGGKIEESERPSECINREIFEETNLKIDINVFDNVGMIEGSEYVVYVYTKLVDEEYVKSNLESKTDEQVYLYNINDDLDLLPSVKYLIPMCRNFFIDENFRSFTLEYK